ncbi:asparagine-linked glycosylation protein [Xanthoria parietina]
MAGMPAFSWTLANSILIISLSALISKLLLQAVVCWYLRRRASSRKITILARVKLEEAQYQLSASQSPKTDDGEWEKVEKHTAGSANNGGEADDEWEGTIGFFHPFCNAGGGGERVLWAAIKATQKRWPKAVCCVYTGDHEAGKYEILQRVQNRFNIELHPPTVVFLYLSTRHYVLSSTWPHFTLLGQSLGSIFLAFDAFSLLVPDIFIDTMGYAFVLAFSKFCFPKIPTGAYVHYPTISTDMLGSLDTSPALGNGLNAGTGKGLRGFLKKRYWHVFANLYSRVGGSVDIVMTNSSWTASHIRTLWGPVRTKRRKPHAVSVVFPPCAVDDIINAIPLNAQSEAKREPTVLYIAQFRPEKNHSLLLRSFARFLKSQSGLRKREEGPGLPKLVLIGSVRDASDATRVYELRLLAHELHLTPNHITFITDASFPTILSHLAAASVGANCMWNEHFGIGVVEYQAAGLIPVVNDSGGPKMDIVIAWEGGETGFKASTEEGYAERFAQVLGMDGEDRLEMRKRARGRARAFGEEEFEKRWIDEVGRLVEMVAEERK